MPDPQEPQSPEILKAIQAAERKVERMVRAAEQEAAAILDRARARADALVAGKRREIEENRQRRLAEGAKDSDREAERLAREATEAAAQLTDRCLRRLDEAAGLVLRRILPMSDRQSTISPQPKIRGRKPTADR
jgi:V/A-type H+-transporting ATPase subunit G/H